MVNGQPHDLLRWIVLLPLMAAVYHGLMLGVVRRPTPRWLVIGLSCGSVFAAFLFSCWAFWDLLQLPEGQRLLLDDVYTWIGSGVGDQNLSAELGFALSYGALHAAMDSEYVEKRYFRGEGRGDA